MTKPMFSKDGKPLMTEEELQDACLHNAATIVVAYVLGCEFKDCLLDDDGCKWPTSVSRIELEYPERWGKAEAIDSIATIHEAGHMAVAKGHGRGPHHINVSAAERLLDDPVIWKGIETLARFIRDYDGGDGCYGALGTSALGGKSSALELIESMGLPALEVA